MENAAQAIRMAAAVLVFILALTVFFTTFTSAKNSSDAVLKMQDKQAYLESSDVENYLYKSKSGMESDTANYTYEGNRIVGIDSVISTIYRYDKEKIGVTIMKKDRTVIARYDSSTESLMNNWNNIPESYVDDKGTTRYPKQEFIDNLNCNLKCRINRSDFTPNIIETDLTNLYTMENGTICAPWFGNSSNILDRIKADITKDTINISNYGYKGKGIKDYDKFIEITKEIDNSQYYKDGKSNTNLLKQYEMPTVEVIYIIIE